MRTQPFSDRRTLVRVGLAWLTLCACGRGGAPELVPIGDQTAVVGETLTIQLFASDPEGDELEFDFSAAGVPDLGDTTSLTIAPDGHGVFTFTPLGTQVGEQYFDFSVSDGRNEDELTVRITVKGVSGEGSLPVFREPLGSGTVLDLEQRECVDLVVAVEDPDSAAVALEAAPPIIDGSSLVVEDDGLRGRWSWCPDREQREAGDRYDLSLSASDGENPPTVKPYIVVLRKRRGAECPGEAPVVEHSSSNYETALDLAIEARVTDDIGLSAPPLILYATEHPGDPIDFAKLQVAPMDLQLGDLRDGSWRGYIPNPTVLGGVGTEATIYYIITAIDDDDAEGECDHLTDSPATGLHEIAVTNDGTADAGVCEHCSYDVQCGGEDDLCVPEAYGYGCGSACTSDGDCEAGYVCSPEPVESIDGVSARQCVPVSGSCGTWGDCEGVDPDGPDDTPAEGRALGALPPGTYEYLLCGSDEDWYLLEVANRSKVVATLDGEFPPDMDLSVTTGEGVLVKQSGGLTSQESVITGCLAPGEYFVRVFGSSPGSGSSGGVANYTIGVELDATGCSGDPQGTGSCCDAHDTAGCESPTIQACVCAVDDFCCNNTWDGTCVTIARSSCDACGGGGEEAQCCTVHDTAGCSDASVQECVCRVDPWCCGEDVNGIGTWDETCVTRVGELLCAPACVPDDADGPCCSPHAGPGCEIDAVEACVCEHDPVCCSTSWDGECVDAIALQECGDCP